MSERREPTKVYVNQGTTLLFATICTGFCVIIWAVAHQRDITPLSLYDIVLKVFIVSACWLVGGIAALLLFFWTVVRTPLIELDEEGMRWRVPIWRVPPFEPNRVQWRDVGSVSMRKESLRGVTTLKLTLHMKHAATITHHVPREVHLSVSQMLLSVSADGLLSMIGRYKPVMDADKRFKRLIAQYHERLEHEPPDSSPNHETSA